MISKIIELFHHDWFLIAINPFLEKKDLLDPYIREIPAVKKYIKNQIKLYENNLHFFIIEFYYDEMGLPLGSREKYKTLISIPKSSFEISDENLNIISQEISEDSYEESSEEISEDSYEESSEESSEEISEESSEEISEEISEDDSGNYKKILYKLDDAINHYRWTDKVPYILNKLGFKLGFHLLKVDRVSEIEEECVILGWDSYEPWTITDLYSNIIVSTIETGDDASIIEYLINIGMDNSKRLYNILIYAVECERIEIAKLLINTIFTNKKKKSRYAADLFGELPSQILRTCHPNDGRRRKHHKDDDYEIKVNTDFSNYIADIFINAGIKDAKDEDGLTLMHHAARQDNEVIVKRLIDAGADMNMMDKRFKWTPLHYAAERIRSDIAKLLIKEGADLNLMDNDGDTPLHIVFQFTTCEYCVWDCECLHEFVKHLLDAGAEFRVKNKNGETPMDLAIENRKESSYRMLHQLLRDGTDVGVSYMNVIYDKNGNTFLHKAVLKGHIDIVKLLLVAGADKDEDINVKNNYGNTPLHYAAANDHTDTVKLLLDAGADKEVKCEKGWTPLHSAAERGHANTVKLLLDAGAYKDVMNNDGNTPLHYAVLNGHCQKWKSENIDIIKMFLDAGADCNVKNVINRTSLHLAVDCNNSFNTDITKLLLDAGADKEVKDWDGMTPLHFAVLKGHINGWASQHIDNIKLLLNAGAYCNVKDKNGDTPLLLALSLYCWDGLLYKKLDTHDNKTSEVVKLLTEADANWHIKNKDGKTSFNFVDVHYFKPRKI